MRLQGKTAIVTGGAQGIGREYAARFAREGANVVITDIREEQAGRVARQLTAAGGGKVAAIQSDVTRQDEMNAAAAFANREFGHVDVLVNNAAIYYDLDLTNQSIEYGRKVLDVNLFGIIIGARAVFPYMKQQRCGTLINIATIGA
jgi:NAD(P)-dependent dehydrogenase (short-subunit alcohol dehydrogenase family)